MTESELDLPLWMVPSARPQGMDDDLATWGFPCLNVSFALEALRPTLHEVLSLATAVVESLERVCGEVPDEAERAAWETAFGLPQLRDTLRSYAIVFSIAAGGIPDQEPAGREGTR